MTTKEFIKQAKQYNVEVDEDHNFINIFSKDDLFDLDIYVSKIDKNSIDTSNCGGVIDSLFKLIVEYASTQIEDRQND